MEDKLISLETAKLAKEKGFPQSESSSYLLVDFSECNTSKINLNNLKCGDLIGFSVGEKSVSAPTQSLLQKWLREVHDINIGMIYFKTPEVSYWAFRVHYEDVYGNCNTYEKALEEGLKKALELIKA